MVLCGIASELLVVLCRPLACPADSWLVHTGDLCEKIENVLWYHIPSTCSDTCIIVSY